MGRTQSTVHSPQSTVISPQSLPSRTALRDWRLKSEDSGLNPVDSGLTAAGFSNGGEDGQPAHKILLLPQADDSSASNMQRKKSVDAGKSGAKKTDTVHPALASTVLTMAANVLPVAAASAPATVLVIAGGANAGVSTNPVLANGHHFDTATNQTPKINGNTDAGSAAPAKMAQADLPAAPGTGRINSSAAEEKTLPPGNMVELEETQKQPATIIIKIGSALEAAPGFGGRQSDPSSVAALRRVDSGTAVAKQDTTVKMAVKKTNYSAVEQKLPGSAAVATGDKLPAPQLRVLAPLPPGDRSESVLADSAAISAGDSTARPFLPEVLELPRIASIGLPYVQRTQELISLQAMRLHETGADEIHVTIKPDNGLQLTLHLQQRGGGVEVRAVLDRGNFGLLNRHWPELQQQLESRGVRVAPLANADPSIGGGSEGFRQPTTPHGQHAGDDAEPAEMPVVLFPGLPPATATASASRISTARLETWA